VNSADAERPHQGVLLLRAALLEAGVTDVGTVNTHGPPFRVSAAAVRELLGQAGFVDVRTSNHVAIDLMKDVDEYLAWMHSSAFGNFLLELSDAQRARMRAALEAEVAVVRTPAGIRLERYLVSAAANKA
jgi:hypothetical protein